MDYFPNHKEKLLLPRSTKSVKDRLTIALNHIPDDVLNTPIPEICTNCTVLTVIKSALEQHDRDMDSMSN